MDVLREIVGLMAKEELRAFKLYAKRTDSNAERKDLILFDYIRTSGEDYDEEEIISKLYPDGPRNSFHRLKSRLQTEILKSQMVLSVDNDEFHRLHFLMNTIHFYSRQGATSLVHHFLRKAERLAIKIDHYEILDVIYNEYIKLAQVEISINPTSYIEKRRANANLINRLRDIDDILATVSYRLKSTQNLGPKDDSIIELLSKTVREFTQEPEAISNPKLRIRLYEAVSKALIENRDFKTLEEYLVNTIAEFNEAGLFTKQTHGLKLQMQAYLVNAMHKNGKYEESLEEAARLKREMIKFDKVHHEQYLFFWYNSQVINYFVLDTNKAIEVLLSMKKEKSIMKSSFFTLFVFMNLSLAYYMLGEYKKALKQLVGTYTLDGFKVSGVGLRLRLSIAELIIRYRLEDIDTMEHRAEQVKKDFATELGMKMYQRDALMLTLMLSSLKVIDAHKDKKLVSMGKKVLKLNQSEAKEEELVDYDEFVKELCRI